MTVLAVIEGGLGNQLFQYAAARRLAHVNRARLRLGIRKHYGPDAHRSYGLARFNITARPDTRGRLGMILAPSPRPVREPFIFSDADVGAVLARNPRAGAERCLLFDPGILALRGHIELRGYWQDERYFTDIGPALRQELSLRDELDPRNAAVAADMRRAPSVFIHVRRGDYLAGRHLDMFGTCSPAYYDRALAIVRARAGARLRIYTFSDDPAWLRANRIGGDDACIIDWNGDRPERDIALMRLCCHAIIANSSFSWWGAWLGEQPGGTVIAPSPWLSARPTYEEIVPPRWLRLDRDTGAPV